VSAPRVARERATVLVVGVGGLGCPAAIALADAGVARLLLVDPDVVEPSNLPRQVLFSEADVGRPKALVAAAALAREGLDVQGIVGRFDGESGPPLAARCDVLVDATDGAATKDLVNRVAVRASKPYVHAAALGHEGRALDVPAGGRPCLACLFGTFATDDGDTCAALGVMPGVVGTAGFLAAQAALARLEAPDSPSAGLRVLDLASGRGVTLEAPADPACPVCGAARGDDVPAPGAGPARRGPADRETPPAGTLDLRTETCPMNLLRARRAVERLAPEETLEVWLGVEGAATVPDGLASQGHALLAREPRGEGLRLVVRRGAGASSSPAPKAEGDAWLRRYARQIVLPDVGEPGQRRLSASTVLVAGRGDAALVCALYLAAAGVGTLVLGVEGDVGARAGRWPLRDARASDALRHALARELPPVPGARVVAMDRAQGGVLAAASVAAFAGTAPVVPTPGRRIWAALAPGGRGGIVVRLGVSAPEAWASLPPSVLDGPVGCAAGALLADAAMRRVLAFPATASDPVLRLDGTLDDRRSSAVTGAGC
jgi:molybdopterin/thiamine biosynthesis adenylyltransferase/TusA-related sulfurtransferase